MADQKISELTAVTTNDGTLEIPVNEGGTTKKLTVTKLYEVEDGDVVHIKIGTGIRLAFGDATGANANGFGISAANRIYIWGTNSNRAEFDMRGGACNLASFVTGGPQILLASASSNTVPAYAFKNRTTTGVGSGSDNDVSLIVNGVEAVRLENDQQGADGPSILIKDLTTAPSSNPSGGGVLYCESGALKYRGSSGTVTTIANA